MALAGFGSLTLMDDTPAAAASPANFLAVAAAPLPPPAGGSGGAEAASSVAEACAAALREMNPFIKVFAEPGTLEGRPADFYRRFDAVVLSNAPLRLQLETNAACREAGARFFAVSVTCGPHSTPPPVPSLRPQCFSSLLSIALAHFLAPPTQGLTPHSICRGTLALPPLTSSILLT